MKKTILAVALVAIASTGVFAQSFNSNSGYNSSLLFSTGSGFSISGVGADSSGNLFYIESGNFGGTSDTRLFERTMASSFSDETELFSYGAGGISGSFVRVSGTTVYFGENSNGTIRSIGTDGSLSHLIATINGNYDLAFSGSTAFLSANPGGFTPENKVYKFDLSSGATSILLDTGGDYSGPIAFDSAGDLFYGATNFGLSGGIFKFSAAAVQQALTSGTALTMANASASFNGSNSNAYLGLTDDHHLYTLNSPFGAPSTATSFDLSNTASGSAVGQTDNGPFFGAADAQNGSLYVAVTSDFLSGPSSVYRVQAVPEPSTLAFVGIAFAALAARFTSRKK